MNISTFIFIDAVLVIAVIPFIFLLQSRKIKSSLLRSSKKEELWGQTSTKIPDKEKLLKLEKIAKIKGSGIELNSLLGIWKFIYVYKKASNEEDSTFSSLLRLFSASLELKKETSSENSSGFSVYVSIQFGLFTIKFSGTGNLTGKQPLLPFFFNLVEIKFGSSILLTRSLKEPITKEKSFFELIAIEESNGWLSARGQGGSLILWLRE